MRSTSPGSVLGLVCSLVCLTYATSVLTPPVLPLIVRNPYLSTWLPNARSAPWEKWPIFYTGEDIGFGIMASVPKSGKVYPLLGRIHDFLGKDGHGFNLTFPDYHGATYDASTTNLTYSIPSPSAASDSKPVKLTLSFLCPITPTSTLRQSIPACYLSILAEGSFDVSVYVDVNGQWVSGDRNSQIEWEYIEEDYSGKHSMKTWKVRKTQEALFTEWADRAEWGTLYFSASSDVDHECGTSAVIRRNFSQRGTLQNQVDKDFRSIMDEEPVFAFSKTFELGNGSTVASTPKTQSVLFTIAHVQDPVVQYASARGITFMRPLWKSWFLEDSQVLDFHFNDFQHASNLAQNYSAQLAVDAYKSGSTSYVDIVALSARQVMGATSFSGTPENPLLFLKEISSNGNSQTVDVIFPSAPFFFYTNPRWLAYLLEPLIEHQLSGQYPNKYSMHDMGTHFPNQTGHPDGEDEYMPVEECGNMLIMGLALANSLKYSADSSAAGWSWSLVGKQTEMMDDVESVFPLTLGASEGIDHLDDSWGGSTKGNKQAQKWLSRTYPLWKKWTGYLVDYSLEPHNQLSTDDFAGWLALQTNLALKGIVGIKAMAEISQVLGQREEAKKYKNISETYIEKWQTYGMSRDGTHAKLAYNWYGSWTTLYSLYADALLCFHPSITTNNTFFTYDESIRAVPEPPVFRPRPGTRQMPLGGSDHTQQRIDFLGRPKDEKLQPFEPSSLPPSVYRSSNPDDFIPHSIYTNQSAWYALVMQRYGLPLDSRHLYTKSDWEFEAAAVAEPPVRKLILDRVSKWINETSTDRPLTDLYETEGTGGFPGPNFMARPVVGGHFAFLALERACGR